MAAAAGNMAPTPGILRQVALNAQVDVRALLPRIRARTLVSGCTHDAIVPVRHARALHLAIAGARYTEFDSGHLVIFERPAELADRIAGFLDDA
jgi:pimeloyl-ACP methyl ester carboxylesterase